MEKNALFLISQESAPLIPEWVGSCPTCTAGVAGLPHTKVAFFFKLLQGHKANSVLLIV